MKLGFQQLKQALVAREQQTLTLLEAGAAAMVRLLDNPLAIARW